MADKETNFPEDLGKYREIIEEYKKKNKECWPERPIFPRYPASPCPGCGACPVCGRRNFGPRGEMWC